MVPEALGRQRCRATGAVSHLLLRLPTPHEEGSQSRFEKPLDFSKTREASFRLELHSQLKKQRKMALRLGRLSEHAHWAIKPEVTKNLLSGKIQFAGLSDDDLHYDVRQKGVDMRIGLDIASLAFKRQVDQIVLIAGDSDFVPAAKLARQEGIDFILDPMWQPIPEDLHEHIDGLKQLALNHRTDECWENTACPAAGAIADVRQEPSVESMRNRRAPI